MKSFAARGGRAWPVLTGLGWRRAEARGGLAGGWRRALARLGPVHRSDPGNRWTSELTRLCAFLNEKERKIFTKMKKKKLDFLKTAFLKSALTAVAAGWRKFRPHAGAEMKKFPTGEA